MNDLQDSVQILTTGGTIGGIDPNLQDYEKYINFQKDFSQFVDQVIKPEISVPVIKVCEKDSREITQEDRKKLSEVISDSNFRSIVITHGTFTMPETAQYLSKQGFLDKTIVLTGSFVPAAGFSESDADYNLGFAVAASRLASKGVHVAMHNQLFDPNNIIKDIENNRFSTTS